MKLLKEYWPALLCTAFLLLCGLAVSVYDILYHGATPKSRQRLVMEHLNEDEVQFVEERPIADGGFMNRTRRRVWRLLHREKGIPIIFLAIS